MNRFLAATAAAILVAVPWTPLGAQAPEAHIRPYTLGPGDIVVADQGADRVVIVRANGDIDIVGSGMASPRSVAIASDGAIAVTEDEADRAVLITPDGELTELVDGIDGADDIVFDDDVVLIVEHEEGRIFAVPRGGEPEITHDDIPGPTGIDVGSAVPVDGEIVIAVRNQEPDGNVARLRADEPPAPFAGPLQRPNHVDFAPDGMLFVSDEAGRIVEVGLGGDRRVVLESEDLMAPIGMAVDPADYRGHPYSLVFTHDDALMRMNPADGEMEIIVGLTAPAGVDVYGDAGDAPSPPPRTPVPTGTATATPGVGQPFPSPSGGDGGGVPWGLVGGICGFGLLGLGALGLWQGWWKWPFGGN